MRARRLTLFGLAAPLAALACACGSDRPASVLLVSFDTTRADRIGAYGYARAETPTLDRLAREGVLFENAIAPTPITLPSHASLLTGVYPTAHGVRDNGNFALTGSATLVSEVLGARGWRTAAFVGSYMLDPTFGLDQGFEHYDGPALRGDGDAIGGARPADRVVDAAIAWLDGLDDSMPFFVFVHFYDPHWPYQPPPAYAKRHAHPYDGEIAFADAELGRLLRALAQRGRDRDLVTIVTADHGEAFGEHGEETHGIFVYQTTLHVPLVVAGEALKELRGRRVAAPVSLASVAASVLALAGVPREALPEAEAPLPLASDAAEAAAAEPLYFESYLPFHTMHWHALRGLLEGGHKLVLGRKASLFDLTDDPGEEKNLADARAEEVARLRGRLDEFEARRTDLGWGSRRRPDADEIAQLAALGYVGGSAEGDPHDPLLPDPDERIEEYRRFLKAHEAWESSRRLERRARKAASPEERERRLAVVRSLREQTLALLAPDEAGGNLLVLELIGKLAVKQGDNARAAAALERAVAVAPGVAATHYNLGLAYRKLGRGADARRAFENAYELEPRQPRFALLVAEQLVESGERERARTWIERARELVPPGSSLDPSLSALERKLAESGSEPAT